jgi:hypothetical protein
MQEAMNKNVTKQLIATRRNIRSKLNLLKSERDAANEQLEHTYQPLAKILAKTPTKPWIKHEPKEEHDDDDDDEQLKERDDEQHLHDTSSHLHHLHDTSSNLHDTSSHHHHLHDTSSNLHHHLHDTSSHHDVFAEKDTSLRSRITPTHLTHLVNFRNARSEKKRMKELENLSFVETGQNTSALLTNTENIPTQRNLSESSYSYTPDLNYAEEVMDIDKSREEQISEAVMDKYLDAFHDLTRRYVKGIVFDTTNEYDYTYVHVDKHTDKYTFGDSTMGFNKKNPDIELKGKIFKGTEGLYELIFKKKPDETITTTSDRKNYAEMITISHANKRHFNPDLGKQGTKAYKYTSIIKPLLNQASIGSGILKQNVKTFGNYKNYKKNVSYDYVHYDDVNELVDRLKLLYASRKSGNNAHNNEIVSIIEELREAHIIE